MASILGLDQYDAIKKLALEKVREGGIGSAFLKKSCELLSAETQHIATYRDQLAQLAISYQSIVEQEQALDKTNAYIAVQKKLLAEKQQVYQKLSFTREQLQQTCTTHEKLVHETYLTWRSVHHQQRLISHHILDADFKKNIEHELNQIQHIINKKLALTQIVLHVQSDAQALQTKINADHTAQQQSALTLFHTLTTQLKLLTTEYATLQKVHEAHIQEQHHLRTEYISLQPQATKLNAFNTELMQQESVFERRKTFYHTFVARGNKGAHDLKKIVLQQQQLTPATSSCCPLCEQSLSKNRLQFLQQQFIKQERFLNHQLHRLSSVIPQLKQILTEQHTSIGILKQSVIAATQALTRIQAITILLEGGEKICISQQQELATYHEKIEKTQQALNHAITKKEALDTAARSLLNNHSDYQALQNTLQKYEAELAHCGYNQARYDQLQQELQKIIQLQATNQDITHQQKLQQKRKQDIRELCILIRKIRQELQQLNTTIAAYTTLSDEQQKLEAEEQALAHQKETLGHQKEQIAHQRGALEQTCARIAQQEIVLKKEQTQLLTLETDTSEYQILAQALSKDGIQGLLIETVIPEIETEANSLLAKLTNNHAQLSIESVRDLKSGGTKETLEIKISDAAGIRPYELFSGGEAFRIDFALRLAVSKLLARRTGTSLQTLIIDEGFGSQDEEGLNHIMESLYAIQEDFAKIIIVSHLPAMKDQFPVHFHVSKTPRGSSIQIIEQG